jgi:hypothetical protein
MNLVYRNYEFHNMVHKNLVYMNKQMLEKQNEFLFSNTFSYLLDLLLYKYRH